MCVIADFDAAITLSIQPPIKNKSPSFFNPYLIQAWLMPDLQNKEIT